MTESSPRTPSDCLPPDPGPRLRWEVLPSLLLVGALAIGTILLGWKAHLDQRLERTQRFDSTFAVHLDRGDLVGADSLLRTDGELLGRPARERAAQALEQARTRRLEDAATTRVIDTARWRRLMFHWQDRMLDAVPPLPERQRTQARRELEACLSTHPAFLPCAETAVMLAIEGHDWAEVMTRSRRLGLLDSANPWAGGGIGIAHLALGNPAAALQEIPHLRPRRIASNRWGTWYHGPDRASRLLTYWETMRCTALGTGKGILPAALGREAPRADSSSHSPWDRERDIDSIGDFLEVVARGWERLGNADSASRYRALASRTTSARIRIGRSGHAPGPDGIADPAIESLACVPLAGYETMLETCRITRRATGPREEAAIGTPRR